MRLNKTTPEEISETENKNAEYSVKTLAQETDNSCIRNIVFRIDGPKCVANIQIVRIIRQKTTPRLS